MSCEACDNVAATCLMSHIQLECEDWMERVIAKQDCKDCLVSKDGYHHTNCIEEICPVCNGVLHLCDCFPALIVLGAA